MSINAIGMNGNNDWLRKKLLERQAQQAMQAQDQMQVPEQGQNIQDLSKLQEVDSANKVGSQVGPQGIKPEGGPPWATMMEELGVKATGTKEGDFAAMSSKMELMRTDATTPADKTELAGLEKQFEQMQAMASSLQPPQGPPEQANQMVGLEQLGEINKLMLLKKKLI